MKKNGLELLLRFAIGPLQNGLCGTTEEFAKKVMDFLETGGQGKGDEIEKEAPRQLKTAWIALQGINKKNPLDYKAVRKYIFRIHNRLMPPACAVKTGKVENIRFKKKSAELSVRTKTGAIKIKALKTMAQEMKKGDRVVFHHNWLMGKTKRLNEYL